MAENQEARDRDQMVRAVVRGRFKGIFLIEIDKIMVAHDLPHAEAHRLAMQALAEVLAWATTFWGALAEGG